MFYMIRSKKMTKRFMVMAGLALVLASGCSKSGGGASSGTSAGGSTQGVQSGAANRLVVWSFTDELN